MDTVQIEKINIALQLEGEIAAAFLKCRDKMGLHTNAPVARGFIVQKLRESGFLSVEPVEVEPVELEAA